MPRYTLYLTQETYDIIMSKKDEYAFDSLSKGISFFALKGLKNEERTKGTFKKTIGKSGKKEPTTKKQNKKIKLV
jgi:hypothetical protein